MRAHPVGIRARTALVATVVVGVTLALVSVGLVFTLRVALRSSIRSSAANTAGTVALLARSGSLPSTLPRRGESVVVQVVGAGSRVIAASAGLPRNAALVDARLLPGETRTLDLAKLPAAETTGEAATLFDPSEPFVVFAQGVQTHAGPVTVLAAASLSPLEDASDALVPLLLYGVPLVLVVVGVTTWVLTGLALRPVSAIRREAEMISSSVPDSRLPVPPAHDEIRDLAETMNRMLDRIEAASLAQRRFTANASHELKSPVAAIRTMLEVARRDPARTDLPALVDDLLAEDIRLELLVADLLLVGQSDEGRLRLSASRFDLAAVIEEEAASLERPGRQLDTSAVEPIPVVADAARVRQLLRNLLDNALRHADSRVWVSAHAGDGFAIITVSDDGPGIPPDARERVFERFVRLDDGRGRSEGGTGLGLAVCRAIASAHGGSCRAVEPDHGGATLQARIPIGLR